MRTHGKHIPMEMIASTFIFAIFRVPLIAKALLRAIEHTAQSEIM